VADSLFAARDYGRAYEAYEALTRRDTMNLDAWFGLGRAAARLERYEQGVAAFTRVAASSVYGWVPAYSAGAMYARLGRADSAFWWLGRAVRFGFSDEKALRTDDDLASLRSDARFDSLVYNATHAPTPCASDAEHRRFDFWVGEWRVTTSGGVPAGSSVVQVVSGGCALLENWTSLRGATGKSLNAYNPATHQWQQYWVGQGGAVTEYRESEWHGPSLSLIARGPQTIMRLTFTPLDRNTVRQHGELSSDGGKTWSTTYDFYYHRKQ
jgi:hypothetical protein